MQCSRCNYINEAESNFCQNCGISIRYEVAQKTSNKQISSVGILFLFYLPAAFGLGFAAFQGFISTPSQLFYADLILGGYFLIFFLIDIRTYAHVLKFKSFNLKILSIGLLTTIAFSIFVFYSIQWLNSQLIDNYFDSSYPFFRTTSAPFLFLILSHCVQPAIFEELAFRGFVLGRLFKTLDSKKSAFIISAFMFALLHISILSMYWMLPLAIAYAWLRYKYKTIWYGVIFHFTHNLIVSLLLINANNEWSLWF